MLTKKTLLSAIIPALLLTACGGSSDESATFSLGISDAPVDGLSQVVICFNQVELKGGDKSKVFTVGDDAGVLPADSICGDTPNTVGIDLKAYTGVNSISLLSNVDVEAGEYTQLRLTMSEGSYAVPMDEDGNELDEQIPVTVPSNELKLDGFTVAQGGSTAYTLEFDLRKSMTNPVGKDEYFLKPRGVRLVDDNQIGSLSGSVDDAFIMNNCELDQLPVDVALAAVYIYPADEKTLLEDNMAVYSDDALEPLASSVLTTDGAGNHSFEIGFVPVGDYTAAFTCNTDDDAELDDDIQFVDTEEVNVAVDTNTEVVFIVDSEQ
ncbi:DUF4382 domain-containing protein [Thalassomonas sp. M1454]|uniref:DUF4382 domain-containing protein n=1 Tax=Thalassomonas sp. M1454 TaxID=2594477 RepID=UPI0011803ED0|nr:DUF4382 domain-containing protein [Thalassomonas sp. M1454]TRX56487.1 DUF4382 domain-containing protein [Thalassomonas sp. M1454]